MPYFDPTWNVQQTSVDWPVGGFPTVSIIPPSTPGYWQLWRHRGSNVFAGAAAISPPLDYGASFTDTSAAEDGVSLFYWAIGYNGNGSRGGQSYSVQAVANHFTSTGTAVGSADSDGSSDYNALPAIGESVDTVPAPGATVRSIVTGNATSYTAGNPQAVVSLKNPLGKPYFDVGAFLWYMDTTTGIHFITVNPGLILGNVAGDPYASGWLLPGAAIPNLFEITVPNYIFNPTASRFVGLSPNGVAAAGPGMGLAEGGGATNPPNGTVGAFSASCSASVYFEFTYCSGPASPTAPPDFNNPNIGGPTQPPPAGPGARSPLPLTLPSPTPLPAVPCCRTAAPCVNPANGRLI